MAAHAEDGEAANGLPQEVRLSVEGGAQLAPAERGLVRVWVESVAEDRDMPLLLTVSVDGTAAELMQGRLLRAQGTQLSETKTLFSIPLAGRRPGAVVLRVSLYTFSCRTVCKSVQESQQTRVLVQGR